MKHEITRADILSLDEFETVRKERRSGLIAQKRLRRLEVGPYATFYFENFDTMWWQIHEMLRIEKGGEAQIEDELRAYSPLHNIQPDTDYPALLVTTADTDDRVVPGHSFKYTAALQAENLGERPQLIRIETRAGHGSGKPTDKAIAEASDIAAFLAYWTGLQPDE